MSGVLRTVGQVAGVVATVAAFVPGGQVIAGIATAAKIAKVATAVAAVSSTLGQALASPPRARGQINDRIIGANNPLPYLMGRSYSGGVQVYDNAYGGEVNDVDNPYRWFVTVHSCAGPVQSVESTLANFDAVSFSGNAATGYYDDYWWRDTQLGATPEGGALTPNFSGPPDWGASYKLSGMCAVGHNLKWSKNAKRFAGGQIPLIGQVIRGVKAYDPRLDSTYPGGSGSQRINNESTWTYTRNPALHALAYAYGRYANGKKVFGLDLGGDPIDLASVVAWANVCDSNDWSCDGTIYEGSNQSKWENLKTICQSGACVPVKVGGILYFDFQSPRTPLATISKDDFSDGPIRDQMGRGWKSRTNTLTPRYRSENHQWNYVQSEAVEVAAFIAEDGEAKADEVQYDLVTDKDQAAELATYEVYQRRERGPFVYPMKPHWRDYRPGDSFLLPADLSPTGASLKVVLRARSIEPQTGAVTCTFETDSDAKHAAAIGATGTSPSTINFPTGEQVDEAIDVNDDVNWESDISGRPDDESFSRALALGTMNVGGGGNIHFDKNQLGDGTPNNGEINVTGNRFLHADGVNRVITSGDIATPFESGGLSGTFYIVYTNVNTIVRFPSFDSASANFFPAVYDEISGQWSAVDNVGALFNFTPEPTDCIVAVGTRAAGDPGISTLFSFLSSDENLYEPNATEGADWSGNLVNRPTELTDGRVPAGLASNGDINRDISITRANSSNILRRTAGGLYAGDLDATLGADWSGNLVNRPDDEAFQRALALGTMNVGGGGNLRFTKNQAGSGAANFGEIRVQGDRFLHPDGVNRNIVTGEIPTHYEGSGSYGTFYVVYTDTPSATRFPGYSGLGNEFFPAVYNEITGQWSAKDNVGTLYSFTPVDSDCIVAVGTRVAPSNGLTTLFSFLSSDENIYEVSADVTKRITGPNAINFDFDFEGTLLAGQTGPRAIVQIVTSSGVTVTSGVSWSLSVAAGSYTGSAPTISGSGVGQISFGSGPSVPGRITLTGTLDGREYTADVDITTTQESPPTGGGGGGGSNTTTGNVTGPITTSFTTIFEGSVSTASGSSSVELTTGGHDLQPNVFPTPASAQTGNVQYQWQRESSVGSGSWSNVGSAANSSPDPAYIDEGFIMPSIGSITCNRTATGLSGSTTYSFRLRARISSGAITNVSPVFSTGVSLSGE